MRSFLTSVVPLVTFGLSQLSSVEAFSQCYYPDGSIPTDWIWEPCTGAKYSSCCLLSEGDICQPDGLCYYPPASISYRGTCTDRTWNDPSCNADICVTGFETTWNWALQCDGAGGAETWACGIIDEYGHESPTSITCPANQAAQTAAADFVTTISTTSAVRYTPPPTVDPKVFSVFTSEYTATLTASERSTILTTTYASTFTSKIGAAAVTASTTRTGVPIPVTSNSTSSNTKGAVTLSIGALVGIIITVIALLSIGLGTAVILRNKRMKKKEEAIRLNSASSPPPPNGPVGRDQMYPYEAPANEVEDVEKLKRKYGYVGPKVDTYEIDDYSVHGRGDYGRREKSAAVGMGMGRPGVAEMRGDYGEVLRSPAPEYSVAVMPVELDASPAPSRGENRPYGRY